MSHSKISALFGAIDRAKDLGSYSIANLAFSCLIDLALDFEKELYFVWEKSPGNDNEDIYYDLLTISDGIRSACIPAPILKKPLIFRSLCNKEEEREEHTRSVKEWILEVQNYEGVTASLKQQILDIFPNALSLKEKYLTSTQISHDEKKEFNRKIEVARNTTFARVEATGEIRSVYVSPDLGYSSFSDIPWDSHNYTISGSINDSQWVVKSDGNPQWIWYYVYSQLPTRKKGESRWLIGQGCDSSSYFEVWVIKDSKAVPRPIKQDVTPSTSFWISTTLDMYRPGNNYWYSDTGKTLKDYWGSSRAIKLEDVSKTANILQHFLKHDRWLVWNRVAKRYDLLRPAQH